MIERALGLGYRMRSLLLLEQRAARFARLAHEGVPVYTATTELMRSITGFAGPPRRSRIVRPQVAAERRRGRARRAARRRARGRQQPHQRRRDRAQRLGARHRRAAARPRLVRPALPALAAHLDGRGAEPPARAHGVAPRRPRTAARSRLRRRGAHARRRLGRHPTLAAAGHERLALLLGTEGAGLSPPVLEEADVRVRIPLSTGVDSLNVAAAAAIAFYALRPTVT